MKIEHPLPAMTIDDIVQKSFAGIVSGEIKADAEAFRRQGRLTPADLFDPPATKQSPPYP